MIKLFQLIVFVLMFPTIAFSIPAFPPDYTKQRVIISTDIGGGDFDDVQSMIHYLVYMDMFDTEAIISSMPRPGARYWKEIVRAYRRDYKNLKFHSADYPTPRELKRMYVLGSTKKFPGNRRKGARAIIKAAMKDDPRPVHVLVWGSATDVAMAVRMKPSIKPKLRVFLIAGVSGKGFNGQGDFGAHQFVMKQRNMHIRVVDEMGRGIYLGGLFSKKRYGNVGFVKKVVRKHGRLGRLFHKRSATINVNKFGIKMGDTPSVFFVMNGSYENPKQESWAGKYCRLRGKIWRNCQNNSFAGRPGAGHIHKHRLSYLKDWEKRLKRLDKIVE